MAANLHQEILERLFALKRVYEWHFSFLLPYHIWVRESVRWMCDFKRTTALWRLKHLTFKMGGHTQTNAFAHFHKTLVLPLSDIHLLFLFSIFLNSLLCFHPPAVFHIGFLSLTCTHFLLLFHLVLLLRLSLGFILRYLSSPLAPCSFFLLLSSSPSLSLRLSSFSPRCR